MSRKGLYPAVRGLCLGGLCLRGLCHGGSLSERPPTDVRLRAGGMHPTGMHSCYFHVTFVLIL